MKLFTSANTLRIWLVPVIVLYIITGIFWLCFKFLTKEMARDSELIDFYEEILTCLSGAALLLIWQWIMARFERLKGKAVRKRIKIYWKFFVVIEVICVMAVLSDLFNKWIVSMAGLAGLCILYVAIVLKTGRFTHIHNKFKNILIVYFIAYAIFIVIYMINYIININYR